MGYLLYTFLHLPLKADDSMAEATGGLACLDAFFQGARLKSGLDSI